MSHVQCFSVEGEAPFMSDIQLFNIRSLTVTIVLVEEDFAMKSRSLHWERGVGLRDLLIVSVTDRLAACPQ